MRERIIEIEFDDEGKGPSFVGSVVRLNELVNVCRVRVHCLDDPLASLKISMRRPDGKRGNDTCKAVRDENGNILYFQYYLTSWATAIEGDLKVSFSIVYSDNYEQYIQENQVVDVFPTDYQRMVTIRVEPSVGTTTPLENAPDMVNSLLERVTLIEEGFLKLGVIDCGVYTGGDDS